ncbi:MAG: alpha/beta fold hydrolase [Devosia sp.]
MPQFLTDDDVTLVYDDLGPRDGAPVVLCHGLTAAGEQFAADAAFFAGRAYRVLVPDVRGHGRSGKPNPMTAEGFGIPRMADDLVAMLDHAEAGPVHWVGNSLGGILALELLGRREARLQTLATFGTAYALSLPRWSAQVIPSAYAVFGRKFYAWMAARGMTRHAGGRPLIASLVERFDPQVGLLAAHNLARYDLIGNALAARLPILMLRGGRDPQVNVVLGPTLRAMRGRPNFTLVEVPEGGHCANLDATEQVRTELLRFWQRSAPR